MTENNYLPKNEEALLEWLKNFSSLLPTLGVNLGISPAETSSLNALILSVKNDIRKGNGKLEDKEAKKEAMLVFLQTLVSRMKKHPSYNEKDYGNKFGIA